MEKELVRTGIPARTRVLAGEGCDSARLLKCWQEECGMKKLEGDALDLSLIHI